MLQFLLIATFAAGTAVAEHGKVGEIGKGLRLKTNTGDVAEGIYRGRTNDKILLEVDSGVTAIDESLVTSQQIVRAPIEDYLEKRKALKNDDFDGRLDLAEWGQQNGLVVTANREAHDVLLHDSTNPRAHAFLGDVEVDGKWVPPGQANGPARRPSAPSGEEKPEKAPPKRTGPLQKGETVTVTYEDGRTVSGQYGGKADGQIRVDIPGGEVYVAAASVKSIQRIDPLRAEYLYRKSVLGDSDASSWWALAMWCRGNGLRAEALDAARATIEIAPGHHAAETFLASPNWPSPPRTARRK